MRTQWLLVCVAALAAATAISCSDDGGEATPSEDTGADVADDSDDGDGGDVQTDAQVDVPPAPEGTRLVFEPGFDQTDHEQFFDFPYPSNTRLTSEGTIELAGFPNTINQQLVSGFLEGAVENVGFPTISTAWFLFDGPIAERDIEAAVAGEGADVWLINIDETSIHFGDLTPVVTDDMLPDSFTPENVLAVAPVPGFVLDPDTTYAYVVSREVGDADGAELGVPEALWTMAHGGVPEVAGGDELADLYAPLWPVLEGLGVAPDSIAAVTVFTTGDAVRDTFELSERVLDAYDIELVDLRVDPDDGNHETFCEILAETTVPEFQRGEPPYDTEGLFDFDDDGMPIEQSQTTIPVVITLPQQEMPEGGFPLTMYFHGSGGLSNQAVERSPVNRDGTGPRAQGPAYVLANHGMASVGSAHPVNPERLPGASSIAYLNFGNLKAMRDTFRQGMIEQRLLLDALLELEIDPEDVSECTGLSLPAGESSYRINPELVMATGQSMGGMYTNLVGSIDPRIRAVVPTGAGGFWTYFILETELIGGIRDLLSLLLQTTPEALTFMHPVFHLAQTEFEPIEPLAYVRRLADFPLPGHPVRPIYEPVAPGDSYFPTEIYDAFALGYGNEQAGDVVWQRMQDILALDDRDYLIDYPVSDNLTCRDNTPYTGVVVQYEPDGFSDPHVIYMQLEHVRHQWGCFLESFWRTGRAILPPPAPVGTPCVFEP